METNKMDLKVKIDWTSLDRDSGSLHYVHCSDGTETYRTDVPEEIASDDPEDIAWQMAEAFADGYDANTDQVEFQLEIIKDHREVFVANYRFGVNEKGLGDPTTLERVS